MADVDDALRALTEAQSRLVDREADRDAAMRERDEAMRSAKAAGATYDAIRARTGLSKDTVTKALNRP